ncbi:unnamed protein product [Amoebophrya sp. A25]|nr:unnamed protein product [Amoebophrya sp. A25]|eukprot:GSA25T00004089001.1
MTEYKQDGPEAQRIASVIPYYPFHGVPRFYDISGMLADPEAFQLCIDIFVKRYHYLHQEQVGSSGAAASTENLGIDCIMGLDARGFVLGPSIALALKKPFIMLRKKGKLPNAVTGREYGKEYKSVDNAETGKDELCMPKTAFDFFYKKGNMAATATSTSSEGQEVGGPDDLHQGVENSKLASTSKRPRVLIIDDLVATGGTLLAACDLVAEAGAEIVECACIVELKALKGYEKLQAKHSGVKVWALISEDVLTLEG